MKKTKAQTKISKVMREYKAGELHSGKGGKVSSASARADGCAIRGKTKGRIL